MTLLDILEKVYGRKKSGELSHHAIRFCEKYNLDLYGENDVEKMAIAFSMLSNKEKKEMALKLLFIDIKKETKEDKDVDIMCLRSKTYKECCRLFHPDNKETGSENIFKFIQEIKFAFWDCDGKPRNEIECYNWDDERYSKKDPMWILRGRKKV